MVAVGGKFIGIQIKPVSRTSHISQIQKERGLQEKAHARFTKKFGGKVFYVFSQAEGGKKRIQNPEIISEIQAEIARLGG